MWHLQRSTLVCILVGLLALFTHNPAEAGMFGWFKRIDVQVSPEIKGAITLHDKPQADMVIKRGTFFEDSWSWDSTRTDADGHFYFAEKTVKAREVLHERQVAVRLLALDYPTKGDEDLFFRLSSSHNLKSRSSDLLTDGMHCELSAEYTMSYLKSLEYPNMDWHGFQSKCRFLHADKVIVSQAELDAAELEETWRGIHSLLAYITQNASEMDTDDFIRFHVRSSAESGLAMLHKIRELETDIDKLNTLPNFEKKFQHYLNKLNKEDQR
ncbi:DUF6795 domain-containing protein [Alkalimonas amylolytica]|uniref:DUF6795 domain-containing protein n=1 Tax=Alkalimonas amylolytica TaxID=152573 RepID=A0A1H3XL77_ALKAM|nr:DUF6795 domain-containing protein [Alkalimonas amylolytica]SDZ99691.1 hypothetical protein SAMN04488051_101279 [Alkalimonas amylolytica]